MKTSSAPAFAAPSPPALPFRRSLSSTTFIPRAPLVPTTRRTRNVSLRASPAHVRMTLSDVVVAGGTGFVGTRLTKALASKGASVTVLTRDTSSRSASDLAQFARIVSWDPSSSSSSDAWKEALRSASAVVNLCGKPIVTRWFPSVKKSLVSSRISPTNALVSAMSALPIGERPASFVNMSAVGYYGQTVSSSTVCHEDAPSGTDFLASLCMDWEKAAVMAKDAEVRTAIMRLGIVLGEEGGALAKMVPAFQLFVGGPLGDGKQWVPWVHVDDVVKAIMRVADDEGCEGVYNCTAPKTVTMNEMCDSLARALKRPNLFAVPSFVIQTALGEASTVLLDGQNAPPKRLEDAGFKFEYSDIDSAMLNIAQNV